MGGDGEVFIYGLCEPDGVTVRYIGQTRSPVRRFKGHLAEAEGKAPPCARLLWLRGLLAQGLYPKLRILARVSAEDAAAEESRLIIEHIARGCDLTNVRHGTVPRSTNRARHNAAWGQRLRALRRARMLTQAELAALIGAHATEVSHWETGRNLPRPGRQRQIVRALGLTPQEFNAATAAIDAHTAQSGDRR